MRSQQQESRCRTSDPHVRCFQMTYGIVIAALLGLQPPLTIWRLSMSEPALEGADSLID